MEEDIDIYADLPSFNLKTEQNNAEKDPLCKCNELRKKLSSLTSQLKNTENINENLERNMASLLKTAKAEIARKNEMINDLRKQLDSVIFRRNNGGPLSFSARSSSYQRRAVVKEENIASPTHSKESEFILHTESHDDEHENKKPQNDVARKPVTLFGERLKKRLMEDEIEEKQKALLKLSTETDAKQISEECIVESDKENGSHTTVINAKLDSTAQNSSSAVSCERNSEKRPNSADDMCRSSKRLKTDNKEDEANGSADNNYIAQCNIKDNFMQYETKDKSAKFEDTKYRAVSEHKETRQNKNCTNEWRKDQRGGSSMKNYDSSRTRKGSTDDLRSSRAASTSNERSNNDYLRDYRVKNYRKNNDYRHNSPSSRSYSRSRSDYESSSNHRLERKSSRTYVDRKYENSKYDNRYRNDVRRGHKSKESDGDKTRYNSKERNNLWNKPSHSPSEIKDKEGRCNSYKNNKCASRKVKEVTRNISDSRKFHESDKTAMENDLRVFSSRTIVNTAEGNTHSVKKSIEQHGQTTRNESYNASANPTENVLAINRKGNTSPEDGEISDNSFSSPEKINISKFCKERAMESSVANVIEDKYDKKSVSTCNSVILKIGTVNTEELKKKVDIDTREAKISKIVSSQTNEDSEKAKQLNSIDEKTVNIDKVHNNSSKDMCKSYSNKKLTDTTNQEVTTVDQINDNNTDDNNFQKHAAENLKSSIIESIAEIEKEVSNPNNENVAKNEVSDANVESMTIKNVSTFNNDTRKTDTEQLESFTQETEAVPNCYTQDNIDKSCVTIKNKTACQIPDKNNIKMNHSYLCDHNYVRNASIDICNLDTICKTSNQVSLECRKAVSEVATMKEVKKEETVNTQLANSVKKTTSTIKSKKEQQKKAVVILRRRRAVTLSDNNASMTVVMNTNTVKAPAIVNNNSVDNDSVLKPRACKLARVCKSGL